MCQTANVGQDVMDAINAAVADLVGQNKMFTNHDVVTVARRVTGGFLGRFEDRNDPSKSLKNLIPAAFRDGLMPGYDVQVISFPDGKGGIASARVYYPNDGTVDPNSYDPQSIKNDGQPTIAPTSVTQTDPNASPAVNPNVSASSQTDKLVAEVSGIGLTASYRLQIPYHLMALMGLSPYMSVYQTQPTNDEIRLSKQAPGRKLDVNKDRRLRLNGKWLGKLAPAGIMATDKFKVAIMFDSAKQDRYLRVVRG